MKYIVEKFDKKGWKKDSEHSDIESAQSRAFELSGGVDCYTEPRTQTKYIVPEYPFEWNGYEYENKKTGEKKQGETEILMQLQKGYFGTQSDDNFICRIGIEK